MNKHEFRSIQKRLGLKNHELAALIGRSTSSVTKYRRGEVVVPGIVATVLRQQVRIRDLEKKLQRCRALRFSDADI